MLYKDIQICILHVYLIKNVSCPLINEKQAFQFFVLETKYGPCFCLLVHLLVSCKTSFKSDFFFYLLVNYTDKYATFTVIHLFSSRNLNVNKNMARASFTLNLTRTMTTDIKFWLTIKKKLLCILLVSV